MDTLSAWLIHFFLYKCTAISADKMPYLLKCSMSFNNLYPFLSYVANTAPRLTVSNLVQVVLGQNHSIPVNVSDADGDPVTVQVDASCYFQSFVWTEVHFWGATGILCFGLLMTLLVGLKPCYHVSSVIFLLTKKYY